MNKGIMNNKWFFNKRKQAKKRKLDFMMKDYEFVKSNIKSLNRTTLHHYDSANEMIEAFSKRHGSISAIKTQLLIAYTEGKFNK